MDTRIKASKSTLTGSGHNRPKGTIERFEGQDRGRLGQRMGVGGMRSKRGCTGVHKMDTELEIWKEEGLRWKWLMRVENMVLDWGRSEMVVNGCLEHLEGRMRLKRVWKFVPQVGIRNK